MLRSDLKKIESIIANHLGTNEIVEPTITEYIEPFLISLNSDDALSFSLEEKNISYRFHELMKELVIHLSALYSLEGAIKTTGSFVFAPSLFGVTRYDQVILKIVYEAEERIFPESLVSSILSTTPNELKPKKKRLFEKIFRTSSDHIPEKTIAQLLDESPKKIHFSNATIRSIIPLRSLDQSIYFNATPRIQTPYLPHFFEC
jgi:hypothetical protein